MLPISFHTRSGELKAARDSKGLSLIELDFPASPPVAPPHAAVAPLAAALAGALSLPGGAGDIQWLGRAEGGINDKIVILPSQAAVAAVVPDAAKLAALGGRGVVVAAAASAQSADFDYVCRCFYPAAGIAEDPVTGSAQCALGPLFAAQLGRGEGVPLRARQLSRRGGDILVTVQPGGGRITLAGRAVTVMRGELLAQF